MLWEKSITWLPISPVFPTEAFKLMNILGQETAGLVEQISLVVLPPAWTTIISLHCTVLYVLCFFTFWKHGSTRIDAKLCWTKAVFVCCGESTYWCFLSKDVPQWRSPYGETIYSPCGVDCCISYRWIIMSLSHFRSYGGNSVNHCYFLMLMGVALVNATNLKPIEQLYKRAVKVFDRKPHSYHHCTILEKHNFFSF